VRDDTRGERIRLRIAVLDGEGAPFSDALVELWQADADGLYVRPEDPKDVLAPAGFCGFGRLPTGIDGTCVFETIRPGRPRRTGRAAGVAHQRLPARQRSPSSDLHADLLRGRPALGGSCWRSCPTRGDRRCWRARQRRQWTFDVRLQADAETVFFDLTPSHGRSPKHTDDQCEEHDDDAHEAGSQSSSWHRR
jgi:protocatechuate 3,4-dioxygenase alpha subunit